MAISGDKELAVGTTVKDFESNLNFFIFLVLIMYIFA